MALILLSGAVPTTHHSNPQPPPTASPSLTLSLHKSVSPTYITHTQRPLCKHEISQAIGCCSSSLLCQHTLSHSPSASRHLSPTPHLSPPLSAHFIFFPGMTSCLTITHDAVCFSCCSWVCLFVCLCLYLNLPLEHLEEKESMCSEGRRKCVSVHTCICVSRGGNRRWGWWRWGGVSQTVSVDFFFFFVFLHSTGKRSHSKPKGD